MKALVLDVDETLISGRKIVIQKSVEHWVKEAKSHFTIHLLSNNPSVQRIGTVAEKLNLSFTCGAAKPRRSSLQNVVNTIKITIVIKERFIVLRKVKKVDDTIAGIISKIVKGFVIPPVKYNKIDNCKRS